MRHRATPLVKANRERPIHVSSVWLVPYATYWINKNSIAQCITRTHVRSVSHCRSMIQGRIQRSVMGGLNFDRFFRIKTTNLYTHKAQKTEQILHNQPKINNFWKSCKKQEKIAHFLRVPCKMLQFCKLLRRRKKSLLFLT